MCFHAGGVWIVGDSLIRWAQRRLDTFIPVLWRGRGGARLADWESLLAAMPANAPPPAVLILHLGTNDLMAIDVFSIRQSIDVFMGDIRARFPDTILVWSDILPRVFYFGARSQKSMEKQRRAINRWARTCSQRWGCHVLHHSQFAWSELSLYRFDGVHLSPADNNVFCNNLVSCINGLLG